MSKEFDELLRGAFPASTDREVLRVVSEGVGLADDVRQNTPWLLNLIGDDLRGTLRRAATIFRFEQACREGALPFSATQIENTNRSCHLLRIESDRFEAHIVRTESEGAFPKDAPIRQDSRLRNQGDLFTDPKIVPLKDVCRDLTSMYAWLTFNADEIGRLSHVCWCMPEHGRNVFLSRVNVMRSGLDEMPVEPHSPTPPDPKSRMKFKVFMEKAIENNQKEEK